MATPRTRTKLESATRQLEAALSERYEISQSIRRAGAEIVLPEHMSLRSAIDALSTHLKAQEEVADHAVAIECHWEEGLVAFHRAMTSKFGNVLGDSVQTFFSSIPGNVRVRTGYDETISVPYAEIKIPGLDMVVNLSHQVNPRHPLKSKVYATFKFRRKYQPLVDEIEQEWRRQLRENSIFLGKAITSDFEFINLASAMTAVERLVYTEEEFTQLDANVFIPIRQPDRMRAKGFSLRRTVLLRGDYGTGKTLTALEAALRAVDCGWTFMLVKPGHNIAMALEFAKQYQPCVVFFEDIDEQTQGQRDTALNEILNTMDGVLSKDSEVITILTTNHADRINQAMLRPGRIDRIIELGEVDETSVVKLVLAYSNGSLSDAELDGTKLMKAAAGMPPAFVAEATKQATLYAMHRGDEKVTGEDITNALLGLRPQFEMMRRPDEVRDGAALDNAIRDAVADEVQDELEDVRSRLSDIWDAIS